MSSLSDLVALDEQLYFPRILCLHGGGSNAKIFRAQCRSIIAQTKAYFRFVFVDAPLLSQAGPCVQSVYADWGPFRRWLPWAPGDPEIDSLTALDTIEDCIQRAMADDDRKGATGEWVALMGFSQGAKVGASILLLQQEGRWAKQPNTNFRFAVLLAGRGPLLSSRKSRVMLSPLSTTQTIPNSLSSSDHQKPKLVLRTPTLHVHGTQDPNITLHRRMREMFCAKESSTVVEWDGDHRVPVKTRDVAAVVDYMVALARQTNVL